MQNHRLRKSRALKTMLFLAGALAFGHGAANAQPTVQVGKIASQESCTYYQNSTGSAAAAASANWFGASAAVAVAWRTWWVKDCVSNFSTMKSSLESALAASGKLAVRDKGANYLLSGTVSAEGTRDTHVSQQTSRGADYDLSSTKLFATMNLTLQDAQGNKTFGAIVRKEIDLSAYESADGTSVSTQQSGQAIYNQLQSELAMAAARQVAFHLEPLMVVGGDGRTIQLNYGAPYLKLGTIIQATSPDGATIIRYNVVAAGADTATAEVDGHGNTDYIYPGSRAIVIESDDPAANGRRMKRVDLP